MGESVSKESEDFFTTVVDVSQETGSSQISPDEETKNAMTALPNIFINMLNSTQQRNENEELLCKKVITQEEYNKRKKASDQQNESVKSKLDAFNKAMDKLENKK